MSNERIYQLQVSATRKRDGYRLGYGHNLKRNYKSLNGAIEAAKNYDPNECWRTDGVRVVNRTTGEVLWES